MYQQIRAVYTKDTIRVYQAFCKEIAIEAVKKGTFGQHFSMNRMTWIKPSFLWMMYRCGWAQKEGQEHVLVIELKRTAFDYMVQHAVLSTYRRGCGMSESEWKMLIKQSDIRCQWDPERDIWGNALDYRSIQLGIRGQAVQHYVNDWIVGISDITHFVKELNARKNQGIDITPDLPKEIVYLI